MRNLSRRDRVALHALADRLDTDQPLRALVVQDYHRAASQRAELDRRVACLAQRPWEWQGDGVEEPLRDEQGRPVDDTGFAPGAWI